MADARQPEPPPWRWLGIPGWPDATPTERLAAFRRALAEHTAPDAEPLPGHPYGPDLSERRRAAARRAAATEDATTD